MINFAYKTSVPSALKIKSPFLTVDFIVVTALLCFAGWWVAFEYKTQPPYVDSALYPVRGIDVSAHNGMMNLDAARSAGIEFVFIKASEGRDFRDSNFRLNYDKAVHAGMKIGAYHFFRFDVDGVDQAVNFIKAIGGRRLDLGVAIDVETHGNARGVDPGLIAERLSSMSDYMRLAGYRVTFYSSLKDYYTLLEPTELRGCPLWVCSFTDIPGDINAVFWQYYHHGRVRGINGDVDLNAFCGTREQFEAFCSENLSQEIQYESTYAR